MRAESTRLPPALPENGWPELDPVGRSKLIHELPDVDQAPGRGPHSWLPVDLLEEGAVEPEPPTIGGIVYPGRRHVFSGDPETGKSWQALALCAEQIQAGRTVAYIDFEMGAPMILERLRALGLADNQIADRFLYFRPEEPLTAPSVRADIDRLFTERQPSLVAVDSFTGALALHGFKEESGLDIETFYLKIADPLTAHGAAIVLLDHLAKDKETRGIFSIGSQRKIGGADVHLGFTTLKAFGRGQTGLLRLDVKKDRGGHLPRPKAAELELVSNPETGRVSWTLTISENQTPDTPFRPTYLMERVSRHLESCIEPTSRNAVSTAVKGNAAAVRLAIETLTLEGYISETAGANRAKLLRSERPYREDNQPGSTSSTKCVPGSTKTNPKSGSTSSTSPLQTDELVPDELDELKSPRFDQGHLQ